MNLENIMNNMELSESDKEYIRQHHAENIDRSVKSIWQVVEDSAGYG